MRRPMHPVLHGTCMILGRHAAIMSCRCHSCRKPGGSSVPVQGRGWAGCCRTGRGRSMHGYLGGASSGGHRPGPAVRACVSGGRWRGWPTHPAVCVCVCVCVCVRARACAIRVCVCVHMCAHSSSVHLHAPECMAHVAWAGCLCDPLLYARARIQRA